MSHGHSFAYFHYYHYQISLKALKGLPGRLLLRVNRFVDSLQEQFPHEKISFEPLTESQIYLEYQDLLGASKPFIELVVLKGCCHFGKESRDSPKFIYLRNTDNTFQAKMRQFVLGMNFGGPNFPAAFFHAPEML